MFTKVVSDKYGNLFNNIEDLSRNCPTFGNYFSLLKERKGYCYGLVCMWGQAILAGDFEKDSGKNNYNKRLLLLTNYYPNIPGERLSDWINALICARINKQAISADFSIIESIRAFWDGLLMYQEPRNTSLARFLGPAPQNATISSRYVGNSKIEKNDLTPCLKKAFSRPFVAGKQTSFYGYKNILEKIIGIAKKSGLPFFLMVGSSNHVIGITLINNQIIYYDANFMRDNTFYCTGSCEILSWCFKNNIKDGYLALEISVFFAAKDYEKKYHNDIFNNILNNYYQNYLSYLNNLGPCAINVFLDLIVRRFRLDILQILRARFNNINGLLNSLLMKKCSAGDYEIVKCMLVNKNTFKLEISANTQRNLLFESCIRRHYKIAKFLLENKYYDNGGLNILLHLASNNHNLSLVKFLLTYVKYTNPSLNTAYAIARKSNFNNIARYIEQKSFNRRDNVCRSLF